MKSIYNYFRLTIHYNEPTKSEMLSKTSSSSSIDNSSYQQLTSNYKYNDYEEEFVFSCKARPFAVLVSSFLPTPPASLIDYELVRDLNLKMTDIQCKKFSFAGNKLRILGSVSTSVQCVHNGRLLGNHHIRARVVSDLNKTFDTHVIAGDKLRLQLCPSPPTAKNDTDEDVDNISKKVQSPKPTGSSWHGIPRPRARDVGCPRPRARDTSTMRPPSRDEQPNHVSDAGGGTFDVSNAGGGTFDVPDAGGGMFNVSKSASDDDDDLHLHHGVDDPPPIPAKEEADRANLTASHANILTMFMAFGDADIAKTEEDARKILSKHCPCGTEEESEPIFTFTHNDGYLFQFGHGRNKCSRGRCVKPDNGIVPSNCVFNDQWCLPTIFSFCSPRCKGGFCSCLANYPDQDGYYF